MNRFAGMTYAAALSTIAAEHADREALWYGGRAWSFAEVKAEIDQASARLAALGVKPGDKVAVWLPNRPAFLWYWLGAAQMGAVAVTLNTRLRAEEFLYQIDQSDSVALVLAGAGAFRDFLGDLAAVCPELRTDTPGRLALSALPKLRYVIACDACDPSLRGVTDWSGPAPESLPLPAMAADPSLPAMIAYSSGTTALPKGAMLDHSVFRKAYDHGPRFDQTADDRLYLSVPLFGILSTVNGVLTFWSRGSGIVLEERFDAGAALEAIRHKRCTAIYLLPVMIDRMLAHPAFSPDAVATLRTGIVVSTNPDVTRLAATRLNLRDLISSYGMTETSSACTRTHCGEPLEQRLTTHGKALPDIEVRIADPDSNGVLPPGEEGEIQIRGYNTMLGYYNKPDETRRAFAPGRWFKTGDLGRMSRDGTLTFLRRIKDGYKHNGFNVATAEVEAALRSHPAIRDAAVTDLPHALNGAIGVAFVIAESAADRPSERDILDFLRGRLASFKVPAHVLYTDTFPLTAGTDKVQKFKLREIAAHALQPGPSRPDTPTP